jgi:hypothetical protein
MSDEEKTKGQLIHELAEMRWRTVELEALKARLRQSEQELCHKEGFYRTILENIPT